MASKSQKDLKSALKQMGDSELVSELARVKSELFEARFKLATGALEDTAKLGHWKREIARINTELRAREIAASEAGMERTA